MTGNSNNKYNFPHKVLLTNIQVSRLRKYFANNLLADIKLSETQLHKTGQSGGFFGGPLLKTGLPLMKNVFKPLAKIILLPLGLTTAASSTDAAVQK